MKRGLPLLLAASLLAACSGEGESSGRMPDVKLPTLGGAEGPSLASCPTQRCLTVLLAPWCGVCRSVSPYIVQLRDYLEKRGTPARIVVGLDRMAALRGFAQTYGAPTLLDERGVIKARGVPLFIISGPDGSVLKRVSGFPSEVSNIAELARALGLQ